MSEGTAVSVIGVVRRPHPAAADRRFAVVPRGPADVRASAMASSSATAVDKAGDPLVIDLPQQTFERTGLAAGGTINASQRPYGVEFADAGNAKAFFLLLNNDWHQDLRSTPVSL